MAEALTRTLGLLAPGFLAKAFTTWSVLFTLLSVSKVLNSSFHRREKDDMVISFLKTLNQPTANEAGAPGDENTHANFSPARTKFQEPRTKLQDTMPFGSWDLVLGNGFLEFA